jgi:ABC-type lipoprotein release transport system permease subunit
MRDGSTPVLVGLAVGVIVVLQVSRVLEAELFGIEPTDLTTLATTAVGFVGIAALASYLPARRARRSDPLQVLRAE